MKWYKYLDNDEETSIACCRDQEVYIKVNEDEENFIKTFIREFIDSTTGQPNLSKGFHLGFSMHLTIKPTYRWEGGKGYRVGCKLERVDNVYTILARAESPLLELLEVICKWKGFSFEYEVIEGLNPDKYFRNYLLKDKSPWSMYL